MRAHLFLGWLVGAVVLMAGCDTNQPLRQEQQLVTLQFRATGASVQEMWTWQVYEDSNQDGVPDDSTGDGLPDVYLWCDPQPRYVGSEMPWSFSTQVDVIPPGSTVPITIARDTEVNSSFSRYDSNTGGPPPTNKAPVSLTTRTGFCNGNASILCNPDNLPTTGEPTTICEIFGEGPCVASGVCSNDSSVVCQPNSATDICMNQGLGTCNDVPVARRFAFAPVATAVSGANLDTLEAETNILYVTDPASANLRGSTGGRCPGQYLGPANVGANPTPWSFVIDRGATVNVQARRFTLAPSGFAVISGAPPIDDPATVYVSTAADPIAASLLVDGSPVGVVGPTTTTSGDPESFIDFFFTSR